MLQEMDVKEMKADHSCCKKGMEQKSKSSQQGQTLNSEEAQICDCIQEQISAIESPQVSLKVLMPSELLSLNSIDVLFSADQPPVFYGEYSPPQTPILPQSQLGIFLI